MAAIQTTDEIRSLLTKLEGEEIASLQVLGINSLKSFAPMPDALVGDRISGSTVDDRTLVIETTRHQIEIDLQRTGRLVLLRDAEPYKPAAGTSRPTVRVVLASGVGLDLTEPAKTKRITVTLSLK